MRICDQSSKQLRSVRRGNPGGMVLVVNFDSSEAVTGLFNSDESLALI